MQELISLAKASTRLGIHVGTLRAWVRDGKVPSYRVGQRFTRVRWDEVLEALRVAQAGDPDRAPLGRASQAGSRKEDRP